MTPGDVTADAWAVLVTVCLLSIVMFFALWAAAAVLTIVHARRRDADRAELLAGLARGCSVSDLAAIDDDLRQILAQEHWREPARLPHA